MTFGILIVLYLAMLTFARYTRRGGAINRRPYRDPYGDAPGAWRQSSLTHEELALVEFARGTR